MEKSVLYFLLKLLFTVGSYLKEITKGGADVVIDAVGMDGKMSDLEYVREGQRSRYHYACHPAERSQKGLRNLRYEDG
ncbi:hypothetical protein J23TS9_13850 [Paenibacillus sp. J23TS9]|nr:hypothetical protein J23TS9_13850 [Paenibacillus sp. J23TS9]